jgi:23S rRNA pseudouridine955/2504/2580 synthase
MLTYTITEADHCRSIESFVRNLLPGATLAYLRKLMKSGHCAVNGTPVTDPSTLLLSGESVSLKESGKTGALLRGRRAKLDILLEDSWIIVFNKPPGLPMHRAAEVDERNLVDLGSRMLKEREEFPGKLRPVNRLDRGTSGAVVLAKNSSAAGMFGRFVKEEGLAKVYLAVVQGLLPEEGRITLPLDGKEAETGYRRLMQGDKLAVAAVYPVTGRMHQIRLHFQSIGRPIVGDVRYGGRPLEGYEGIMLHSFRTALVHPATSEPLTVSAPLPAGFLHLLRELAGDDYATLLDMLPLVPQSLPATPEQLSGAF